MDRTDRETALVALFSFLLGGVIGAGVALLLAPQSGEKTRRQIKDFAEDMGDQATEYAGKLKKKIF